MLPNEQTGAAAGIFTQLSRVVPAQLMRLTSFLLFGAAAISIIRLGWAEWVFRTGSASEVHYAAAVGSSSYFEELARKEPSNKVAHLQSAVAANPEGANAWLLLGLAFEQENRIEEAKKALEKASTLDHQYAPAWALANFYFRRGDPQNFWKWARSAVRMAYDDLRPIVELADLMESNPHRMLQRLGGGRPLERAYLDFLIGRQRVRDAYEVAQRIGDQVQEQRLLARERVLAREYASSWLHIGSPDGGDGDRADQARLAQFTSQLIAVGYGPEALRIWGRLGWFDSPVNGFTNSEFSTAPSGLGFDWSTYDVSGIALRWLPGTIRITMTGAQADSSVLMSQWLVMERRSYRIRTDYRMATDSAKTGLYWTLTPGPGGQGRTSRRIEELVTSSAFEPSRDWRVTDWNVQAKSPGLTELRLIYRREHGPTPTSGEFQIRRIELQTL